MDDEFQVNSASAPTPYVGQLFDTTANLAGHTRVKGGATRDWGAGEIVVPYFDIVSGAACDAATSVKVDIVAADSLDLTTNAKILSTITILNAAYTGVTTGLLFAMNPLLAGFPRKYLGAILTVTGAVSTGAFRCGLVSKSARPQSYKGGVSL